MQKKGNVIIIFLVFFVFMSFFWLVAKNPLLDCDSDNTLQQESVDRKQKQENEKNNDLEGNYISLTVTHDETPEGSEQCVFVSEVYIYDLSKGCIWKQDEISYDTTYPLTVYDKEIDDIFYLQASGTQKKGGLMGFSCATGKIRCLTSEIGYINYIFPFGEGRLFIVGTGKYHAMHPLFCDKNTGKVVEIDWKQDDFLWAASYVPKTEEMYVSCYSEIQEKKLNKKLWKEGKDAIAVPDHYIYRIDQAGNKRKIIKEKRKYIEDIVANSQKIIYRASDTWIPERKNTKIYCYDVNTKKKTEVPLNRKLFCGDYIYLTEDGKQLYYIIQKEKKKGRIYQFCVYDMEEESERVIMETSTSQAINNGQIVKNRN